MKWLETSPQDLSIAPNNNKGTVLSNRGKFDDAIRCLFDGALASDQYNESILQNKEITLRLKNVIVQR